MVKKIQIIEVREYIYSPNFPIDYDLDVTTVEEALKSDKNFVERGVVGAEELAQETNLLGRSWRIVDE